MCQGEAQYASTMLCLALLFFCSHECVDYHIFIFPAPQVAKIGLVLSRFEFNKMPNPSYRSVLVPGLTTAPLLPRVGFHPALLLATMI